MIVASPSIDEPMFNEHDHRFVRDANIYVPVISSDLADASKISTMVFEEPERGGLTGHIISSMTQDYKGSDIRAPPSKATLWTSAASIVYWNAL